MKLGEADYSGGGGKKKNYFKLSEGESVFRILPPMGELAEKRKWAMYYSTHWGYKNHEGKMRIFMSPEVVNRNTKMIEVSDPAHDRIKMLKAKQDEFRVAGNTEAVKKISVELQKYNLDKKWHLNVMTLDGKIGLLKIPHKSKQALDQQIKELVAKGVDPLAVKGGRFFVFKRIGSGIDTLHQVSVYKEKIEVPGFGQVEKEMVHDLSEELIARLETEAFELNTMYDRPTSEQVKQIVAADFAKDYSKIDDILGRNKKAEEEGPTDDEEDSATLPQQAAAPVQAPAPAPKADPAPLVTPTVKAPAAMSDADFFASIGMPTNG